MRCPIPEYTSGPTGRVAPNLTCHGNAIVVGVHLSVGRAQAFRCMAFLFVWVVVMPLLAISGTGHGINRGKSFSLTFGKQSMAPLSSVGRRPLSTPSPSAKRRKLSSVASPRKRQRKRQRSGVPGFGVCKSSIVVAGFGVSGSGKLSTSAGSGKSFTHESSTGVPGSGVGVRARRGVLAVALRQTSSAALKIERVDPGLVHETRAQPAARHPVRHPGCIRCVYDADHTKLGTAYGSHQHEAGGLVCRTVWLAPRPCRLGGDYAVGCIFCADLRQRKAGDASRARARTLGTRKFAARARYADTKWARFEQANALQLAPRGLRQHADTVQHQVAARAYFAPDVAVTEVEHSGPEGDRELFRGGVPQVEDWLRAWRACRTPTSFRAAEANGTTENFIKGSRVPGARRKAFKSMIRVMVFALRSRKLQALSKAKSCTLLFDDRKDFRIVSYRCCTSEPMESLGSGVQAKKSFVSTGRLAVLRRGGEFSKKTLSDVDEDYSRAMANSVVGGFRRIAESPSTNMVDAAVVDRMCAAVRIAVADGHSPAQKCIKFLATGPLPNLLWAGRDRAHAARISTSGPLLAEDTFKAWWDDVFDDRFALVPTIQNSEEWTARLALCQKVVLSSGVQGSEVGTHLDKVIKDLNFAKQRFDSTASPQLLYCALMVAIAMLLAYQASDARGCLKARRRAERRLEEMHPSPVVY